VREGVRKGGERERSSRGGQRLAVGRYNWGIGMCRRGGIRALRRLRPVEERVRNEEDEEQRRDARRELVEIVITPSGHSGIKFKLDRMTCHMSGVTCRHRHCHPASFSEHGVEFPSFSSPVSCSYKSSPSAITHHVVLVAGKLPQRTAARNA
jgi:hypothetical protein